MNLKITKKDWIFLSFVHVFKSDARVKRTRLNVCTTTTSSTSSSSKGPRRSLVAHENRRGFSPRLRASFLRRLGCFSRAFSFRSNFCSKRDSSSLVRGSGGACFGSEKNQIEVPRSCAFSVLRFRSARRRERAHRLERDRA